MIGSLRGKLLAKTTNEILLEVNGVGYEVIMPISDICELPAVDSEVFIYTSLVVREDAQILFGFNKTESKIAFREMLKVSGIGPRMAVAILSTFTPAQLISAIQNEETTKLVKVPGIGKRTAERVVLELKDKVKNWLLPVEAPVASQVPVEESADVLVSEPTQDVEEQAVAAFIELGYKPQQASALVHKHYKKDMSVEQVIKTVLQNL